ncbi:RDD family protein [Streptomyces sp. NBC_01142]|uniref:RDD family protein n=1 Tax=Streptomyces sp. NBC_01142 TaxID=2975865 RepID=UPI002255A9F2|nr:RDD family protein [Streptomyces sp. NBC_01142]MCX4823415.1 RDD family protein [Streptomyces sp. NBC_01142]
MSAPTPATGDGSPTPGYYPDPSIPGYVRYWNGAAWVPGTSRPAPTSGEAMPPAPHSGASAPVPPPSPLEETGPVFLDEEPFDAPSRPEAATAWQADTSRQTGFGGERDHLVSWGGGGQDPRTPARTDTSGASGVAGTSGAPADPRRPANPADPTGGALPGVRSLGPAGAGEPPVDGTVAIRALRRPGSASSAAGASDAAPAPGGESPGRRHPQPQGQPQPPTEGTAAIRVPRAGRGAPAEQAEGTMTIRSLAPGGPKAAAAPAAPSAPAQPQPQPQAPAQRQPQPQAPAQPQQPQPQQPHVPDPSQQPVTNGPGGGAASWPQQVRQLAQSPQSGAEAEQPVVPWKPPVNDPFLQAAQAQAAARPASLGKRLAARLIDTVLLGVLVAAAAVPVVSQARAHIDEKIEAAKQSGETVTVWLVDGTTAGHLGIILGALLVLGVLYEALPTAKWGRTLGKKLCGLTVWGIESREPPSFGAALRRWLVYGVLGILAVGVLNVLWCLFDRPWRQCWHDKAAHTFVAG